MARLVQRVLFPYWQIKRGMTFGVQGVILTEKREVLLVRHGYRPGWHFPGGGVEKRETMLTALAREVEEETGVIVEGEPRLHGVFANFQFSKSDHVAVFLIERWHQPKVPEPNFEIREQRLFPIQDLPPDTAGATTRRLGEIFESKPIDQYF